MKNSEDVVANEPEKGGLVGDSVANRVDPLSRKTAPEVARKFSTTNSFQLLVVHLLGLEHIIPKAPMASETRLSTWLTCISYLSWKGKITIPETRLSSIHNRTFFFFFQLFSFSLSSFSCFSHPYNKTNTMDASRWKQLERVGDDFACGKGIGEIEVSVLINLFRETELGGNIFNQQLVGDGRVSGDQSASRWAEEMTDPRCWWKTNRRVANGFCWYFLGTSHQLYTTYGLRYA